MAVGLTTCRACGKVCARPSGLYRHVEKCPVAYRMRLYENKHSASSTSTGEATSKGDYVNAEDDGDEGFHQLQEDHKGDDGEDGDLASPTLLEPEDCAADALGVYEDIYDATLADVVPLQGAWDIPHRTPTLRDEGAAVGDGGAAVGDEGAAVSDTTSITTVGSMAVSRGRLSSSSGSNNCVRESFEQVTGKKAGCRVRE